jgi:hypothetical protein
MQDDELLEVHLPKKGHFTGFSSATAGRAQKLEEKKEIKPYLLAAVQVRDGYHNFHEMKGKPNQHPTVIKSIYTFARDFVKEYDDCMTSAVKVSMLCLALPSPPLCRQQQQCQHQQQQPPPTPPP